MAKKKKKDFTITSRGVTGPGGAGGLGTMITDFLKPKKPARPPSGSYDPILDAQERAAGRGILDLQLDTEQARERGQQDYQSAVGQLTASHDRTLADMLTANTRLGNQQDERARQSGVMSEGLLRKSDTVRDKNYQQGVGRENENFATNTGLLKTQFDRQYGDLGDLTTQLTRAQRENVFLGEDIQAQRAYQAAGTGWAPAKPKPRVPNPARSTLPKPKRRRGASWSPAGSSPSQWGMG